MSIIQAIIMGIVQGLSEFLPISSSAHLVFTSNIYKYFKNIEINFNSSQDVFIDIMLHLGTLIAVLIYFRKEICDIIKSLFKSFKQRNFEDRDTKIGLYIIIGTFFTLLVAYPLKDVSEKLVNSPFVVALLLIFTGVYLFVAEYYTKKIKDKKDVTLKNSILIGIAQGLAAFPGLSRSGLTIATGLFAGLDRVACARYSFLLSIPIILGTSMIYPILEIDFAEIVTYNWTAIIIGTVVSGIVGFLCIKYFLKFLAKFSLRLFGYYCVIIGVLMAIFFKFYVGA